jgi:hypothetical protein
MIYSALFNEESGKPVGEVERLLVQLEPTKGGKRSKRKFNNTFDLK